MIIGFVALSTIPTLATFSPIMRAWLWPHLAWAYALGPATILVVGVPSDIVTYTMNAAIDLARIRVPERPVMRWLEQRWGE